MPVDVDDTELMYEMDLLGEEVANEAIADETPAYALDLPDVPTGIGVPAVGLAEEAEAEADLVHNS